MTKPKDGEPDDLAAEPDELDQAEVELDQAEQELSESLSLVSAIEERVSTGDGSVTSEDLSSKHSLGRFAQLRVQALRAKVERLRGDAHRAMCKQVADQAQQLADESGPALAEALRNAQDAARAFIGLAEARNAKLADLREQARALVPEFIVGPGSEIRGPSAAQARLGWQGGHTVLLGRRKLQPTNPAQWLGSGLAHVPVLSDGLNVVRRHDGADPVEMLRKIDDEQPVRPGLVYYRAGDGHPIGFGRPLTDLEKKTLRRVSDEEVQAWQGGAA